MINKPSDATMPFLKAGKEQTGAMVAMQNELLKAYERASCDWMARAKSETDLWSNLAEKLMATRSIPEALVSYQNCVAQRMQMAVEDGRRLLEECQKITQKSLSNGWSTGIS